MRSIKGLRRLFNFLNYLFFFLLTNLGQAQIDAETIEGYLKLSEEQYAAEHYYKALNHANEALKLAEVSKNTEHIAQSYFQFAQSLTSLEFFKISIAYVHKIMDEPYYRQNALFKAKVHNLLAFNYAHLNAPEKFFNEVDRALKFLDSSEYSLEKFKLKAETYGRIGFFYKIMNKSDSLYKYLRLEERLYDSIPKYAVAEEMADFLLSKGYADLKFKQTDSIQNYFLESLDLKSHLNDSICYDQYYALASYYEKLGLYEKSLRYYLQAQENLSRNESKDLLSVNIHKNIANVYDTLGESQLALSHRALYNNLRDSIRIKKIQNYCYVVDELRASTINYKGIPKSKVVLIVCTVLFLIGTVYIHSYRRRKSLEFIKNRQEAEARSLRLKINTAFDEVVQLAERNDSQFLKRFEEVYPEFTRALAEKHPDLTKSERIFCGMIALNFSTKEIAANTFIEHRSVQKKRSRLRKKLGLNPDTDLYVYFNNLTDKNPS